jgi:DNA-binding transcriptional ArsR family regulator
MKITDRIVGRGLTRASGLTLKQSLDYCPDIGDPGHVLDHAFQALADPTRRAVIERLCAGPASVSELAKPFDMTLAAVVQHIQVLEAAELVQTQKIGRVRTVRIEPAGLRSAEEWLVARRTIVEQHLDRLAVLLTEHANEPSTAQEE